RITDNTFWLCGTNPGGTGDDISGGVVINSNGATNTRGAHIDGNLFSANVNDIIVNGNNGSNSANTGANDISVVGNTSEETYRRFCYVQGANVVRIVGNGINGCSQETTNTYCAIHITGTANRCLVADNTATAN